MSLKIEHAREWVEHEYVGFSPSTSSIKPVHIANGLFRAIMKCYADTHHLNEAVFISKATGEVPKAHGLSEVYNRLRDDERLDPEIAVDDLAALRAMLRKVVNADGAVYNEGMESYSAGQAAFLSKDRIGQDGGEWVAAWLERYAPSVAGMIHQDLESRQDVISILAAPLLNQQLHKYNPEFDYEQLCCFREPTVTISQRFSFLADAICMLDGHLRRHANKLLRLRHTVLFACFVLARHLAWLEYYYVPGASPPIFLLDFSSESSSAIARASQAAYIRVCQAISRFYVWAFAEYLRACLKSGSNGVGGTLCDHLCSSGGACPASFAPVSSFSGPTFDLFRQALRSAWSDGVDQSDFLAQAGPTYKNKPTNAAMQQYWELAQGQADAYTSYAQAIYDILAMEAESNPINYLRQLGIRSGIMQPTSNRVTAKRFAVRPDMLEVLVRSMVAPGESLDVSELLERLWQHYHIVIGGRAIDETRLLDAQIYQANAQALQENLRAFEQRLQDLSFARMLADGVLQVEVRDDHADGS